MFVTTPQKLKFERTDVAVHGDGFLMITQASHIEVVDSQVHLWAAPTASRPWGGNAAGPSHGPESVLKEDVLTVMDDAGVSAALLVPPSFEGDYNDLVIEASVTLPNRFAALGRYPVDRQEVREEILRSFRAREIIGVRLTFNNAADEWLARGTIDWFWTMAAEEGIPVSMFPYERHFASVVGIARRYPELRLSLDHVAAGALAEEFDDFRQVERLEVFADLDNVALKVSALPNAFPTIYDETLVRQVMDVLVPMFGARRLQWGSDFTRAPKAHSDYSLALDRFRQGIAHLPQEDQELILGRALREWLNWPVVIEGTDV